MDVCGSRVPLNGYLTVAATRKTDTHAHGDAACWSKAEKDRLAAENKILRRC